MVISLHMSSHVYEALRRHLIGDAMLDASEAAAFAFIRYLEHGDVHRLEVVDWMAIGAEGFEIESPIHIELTDETRAAVIRRAHELDAGLVEFHSHLGPWPAQFSFSDRAGLEEFVPHVRWRLPGRPYAAVVVTKSDFDALVWMGESDAPLALDHLDASGSVLIPTGRSLGSGVFR